MPVSKKVVFVVVPEDTFMKMFRSCGYWDAWLWWMRQWSLTKLPEQAILWLAVCTLFLAANKMWSPVIFVGISDPFVVGSGVWVWVSIIHKSRMVFKNQDIQSQFMSLWLNLYYLIEMQFSIPPILGNI